MSSSARRVRLYQLQEWCYRQIERTLDPLSGRLLAIVVIFLVAYLLFTR